MEIAEVSGCCAATVQCNRELAAAIAVLRDQVRVTAGCWPRLMRSCLLPLLEACLKGHLSPTTSCFG